MYVEVAAAADLCKDALAKLAQEYGADGFDDVNAMRASPDETPATSPHLTSSPPST